MDGLGLLEAAWAAGLEVRAEGDLLVVRGPKSAAALAQQLITEKAAVLPLLDPAPLVDRELRTQARDLVAVAEMYTFGSMLNWCELQIWPHLTLKAGEDAWTRFLRFPAPGVLQAALEAAKAKMEQEYPF